MNKVPYLVFQLANLQVYTMQQPTILAMVPSWAPDSATDNYYWRDPASPQGYGPFTNITACIEHYKWVIETTKTSAQIEPKKAEVIRFDFQNKKRVITDI